MQNKHNATKLTLKEHEIHLWQTAPQDIHDSALLERYSSLLTDDERQKQQRYIFEKDQHSALITRAFVRDLLSHYCNIDPENWRFSRGEHGKPEVLNAPIPIRFNLSHTKNLIICAVTLEHDIGCDVEYMKGDNKVLDIAVRFFSAQEIKALFTQPKNKQRSRFFDYWTLKESYIKAWGKGMAIPLSDFSFKIGHPDSPLRNDDIQLDFSDHREGQPTHWRSWLFYPNDTHRIAVSLRKPIETPELNAYRFRFFKSEPLHGYEAIDL